MSELDRWIENGVRGVARRSSRRSFLARLGTGLAGGALLPLLPVARPSAASPEDPGDIRDCEYWRYCGIDGFLCSCCGGSQTACPPGAEPSAITWVGTCTNPGDGKAYVISYNDCCGKSSCGRCFCNENERETPIHQPPKNNDINWCHGTTSNVYHCSVGVIVGVSEDA
jgi:methylamine dehydrogenase light chain